MEIAEKTSKEIEETTAVLEKGLVYRPEYNYAILTFLTEMLPELQARGADLDVFTEFEKYWQTCRESDELSSSFAKTNPLILKTGVHELCKQAPEDRKRILATLTERQAEQVDQRRQMRGRAAAVAAIIRDLPMQTKFLLVALEELTLLSSAGIDNFENIRAELRKESDFIVDVAREDPVFLVDVHATLGEQLESNDADKLFHDTRFLIGCYDLAKLIREAS